MRDFIRFCVCIPLLSVSLQSAVAQCSVVLDESIPDQGEITIQIEVSDLVNADLSGTQGLCAVQVRFRHNYIGDLTIALISPSGQSVQLVGAVTDQIDPTNLITWDVRFVSCGFPAAPDAGFSNQWNNEQDWEFLMTYTGSYYPYQGCLEDFNTGSANGIWQLVLTDHSMFQSGEIESITLIFCDATGLDCQVCGADAGEFPESAMAVCEGTSSVIETVYSDTIPDPALFGYSYVLGNGVSHTFESEIRTELLSAGTYTICGMSYGHTDSAGLFNDLSGLTLPEIRSAFEMGTVQYCADLTPVCLTLVVDPRIDTMFRTESICSGSSVTVGGQVITSPGIHIVNIKVPGACDSVVVLDLTVTSVDARIIQMDTISCDDPQTVLDGSTSIVGAGGTYSWTTQNGTIVGPSNQATVVISGAGSYTLVVAANGCSDEATIIVAGDGSIPFISVKGGTLTCKNPSYTFNTVVFPSDVTVLWNGPGGFTSDQLRPTVNIPGTYLILATDPDGCTASESVEVLIDTMRVKPSIERHIECANSRTLLIARPGDLQYQDKFSWSGPNGFTSTSPGIYAVDPGVYCVSLTPSNGCPDSTCITVQSDYGLPDVEAVASADTLHCNQSITLTATSMTAGVSYTWSGPAGFISSTPAISVSSEGQYLVAVLAPNGCANQDTVIVVNGSDIFFAQGFTDTLSCLKDTALIGAVTFEPGATYAWDGPAVLDTFDAYTRVTQAGIYSVSITVNNCTRVLHIRVFGDYVEPNFTPITDTITCTDPIAELSMVIATPYKSQLWEFPDGTTSTDSLIQTTLPGKYILTLFNNNGCSRARQLIVPVDTAKPLLFLESDPLGCDSTQIRVLATDSIMTFTWSGPNGFNSQELNPYVQKGGAYVLMAAGPNGCLGQAIHFILEDTTYPGLITTQDELDCVDSMAVLTAMSPDTVQGFAWFFNGSMISDTNVLVVNAPGTYVVEVTGRNSCVSTDTLKVVAPVPPDIVFTTDTITCLKAAQLTATSDSAGVVFHWMDSQGGEGTGPVFTTPYAGMVLLTATGSNGCTSDTLVPVALDTMAPVAIAQSNEMILCNHKTVTLDGTASLGQMLTFFWTTQDGSIDSGEMTAVPTITGEGTYILSVTDNMNGCTDTDTIQVRKGQSVLGEMFLTVIMECEGNGNGSVTVDSVPGAATALTYELNGIPGGPQFRNLQSGEYLVAAMDTFGCRTDTVVSVSNTSSMSSVNLGEDRLILLGDSTLLTATLGIDPGQLVSVQWLQPMQCDSCLVNFVSPLETQQYGIRIEDVFGCYATDYVTVHVEERGRFYIPNVFSPNGDEINDRVEVLTHPGVERVESWTIYDRWGDVVLHETDFDASLGNVAWDGMAEGRPCNPGVFVYVLELKLLTGRTEIYTGTITLLK